MALVALDGPAENERAIGRFNLWGKLQQPLSELIKAEMHKPVQHRKVNINHVNSELIRLQQAIKKPGLSQAQVTAIRKEYSTLHPIYLNSVARSQGQTLGFSLKKYLHDASNDITKVARAAAKDVATAAKDVEKAVVTVAASPARLAALALISADDLGLAKSMAAGYKANPAKLTGFWTGIGGNIQELLKAINQGAGTNLSGVGCQKFAAEKATIGADVGSEIATPIIHAIMDFLASIGIVIPADVQAKVAKWLGGAIDKLGRGVTKGSSLQSLFVPPSATAGVVHLKKPFPVIPVVAGVGVLALGTILLMNN